MRKILMILIILFSTARAHPTISSTRRSAGPVRLGA